jgi:hypothetical protein
MKKHQERRHWSVLLAEGNDDHALLIQMALERASRIPAKSTALATATKPS